MPPILDDFDRRLLVALQQNARLTGAELAEIVPLSPAACLRRVQRLRADGVILGEVAVVSPEAVGQALSVTILVTVEAERRDLIEDFKRRMRRRPEVMMCFYVTGAVDFVVLATFADMADFEAFVGEELHEDRNVKRFETLVTMNRVKVGLSVPIP